MAEQLRRQGLEELAKQAAADVMTLPIGDWIERYCAPDFVWDTGPMGIGVVTDTHDAFREFFEEWTGAYSDWFLELVEQRALNHEVVVASYRQGGRPYGSDQTVELRYGAVTVWRDGLAQRTINHTTFEEALAAAEEMVRGG
jgi:SnoaL-like domain